MITLKRNTTMKGTLDEFVNHYVMTKLSEHPGHCWYVKLVTKVTHAISIEVKLEQFVTQILKM